MELTLAKKIIFDAARAAGLEEYEIYYMSGASLSAEALKDSLSAFSCGQGGGISLRCTVDGKMGYASTELFEQSELVDLVRRACDNARYIEKEDTAPIFAGSECRLEFYVSEKRSTKYNDSNKICAQPYRLYAYRKSENGALFLSYRQARRRYIYPSYRRHRPTALC